MPSLRWPTESGTHNAKTLFYNLQHTSCAVWCGPSWCVRHKQPTPTAERVTRRNKSTRPGRRFIVTPRETTAVLRLCVAHCMSEWMRVSSWVRWSFSLRVYMITTISFISRASLFFGFAVQMRVWVRAGFKSSSAPVTSLHWQNQDGSFSLRKVTSNMHLEVFTFQSCVRARLCQKLGGLWTCATK